ncbi:MAG: hypothetical protein ACKOA4_04835 [Haliscomenobacter sp.]
MKPLMCMAICMAFSQLTCAQSLISRTGHVRVQSTTRFLDVVANNYQVAGLLDMEARKLEFTGLTRSFDFDLGVANQLFNSKKFNVLDYPKVEFKGKFAPLGKIDLAKAGTYKASISGLLKIGDMERITETVGTLTVDGAGNITGSADFDMPLQQISVDKINRLMKQYIPSVLNVEAGTLGVSNVIKVNAKIPYTKQ